MDGSGCAGSTDVEGMGPTFCADVSFGLAGRFVTYSLVENRPRWAREAGQRWWMGCHLSISKWDKCTLPRRSKHSADTTRNEEVVSLATLSCETGGIDELEKDVVWEESSDSVLEISAGKGMGMAGLDASTEVGDGTTASPVSDDSADVLGEGETTGDGDDEGAGNVPAMSDIPVMDVADSEDHNGDAELARLSGRTAGGDSCRVSLEAENDDSGAGTEPVELADRLVTDGRGMA